jgi:hypothetical protein
MYMIIFILLDENYREEKKLSLNLTLRYGGGGADMEEHGRA